MEFMKIVKLIDDGDDQVVILPADFRFDGDEVLIKKSGNAVVLIPLEGPWDSLLDSLSQFAEDFMAERVQPTESVSHNSRESC